MSNLRMSIFPEELREILTSKNDFRKNLLNFLDKSFTPRKGQEDLIYVLRHCQNKYAFEKDKFNAENALAFIKGIKFGNQEEYNKLEAEWKRTRYMGINSEEEAYFGINASFPRTLVIAKLIHDSLEIHKREKIKKIAKKIFEKLSQDENYYTNAGKMFVHFSELLPFSEKELSSLRANVFNQKETYKVFSLFGLEPYNEHSTEKQKNQIYKKLDKNLVNLSNHYKENNNENFGLLEKTLAKEYIIRTNSIGYMVKPTFEIDFKRLKKELPKYCKTSDSITKQEKNFSETLVDNYNKALVFEYMCDEWATEALMEKQGITRIR